MVSLWDEIAYIAYCKKGAGEVEKSEASLLEVLADRVMVGDGI